jgi:uncharacterized membrane protein YgaE (UPF0421/DUF939 family)
MSNRLTSNTLATGAMVALALLTTWSNPWALVAAAGIVLVAALLFGRERGVRRALALMIGLLFAMGIAFLLRGWLAK